MVGKPTWVVARYPDASERSKTLTGHFMSRWPLKNILLVAWLLTGCTTTQGNSVAVTLNVQELPISQSRETVIPEAETLWASTADCTVQRTGYGNTRRAWFLETCEFSNSEAVSIHNEIPTSVSYYFLEDQLVQINMAFTTFTNVTQFQQQIQDASLKLEPRAMTAALVEDSTLRVFNDIASQIHVLHN